MFIGSRAQLKLSFIQCTIQDNHVHSERVFQHEPDCKYICKYTLLMNIIEVEKDFAFTCML